MSYSNPIAQPKGPLHWHVVENMPGFLPEKDPTTHASWVEARDTVRHELENESHLATGVYAANIQVAIGETWAIHGPAVIHCPDSNGTDYVFEIQHCDSAACEVPR